MSKKEIKIVNSIDELMNELGIQPGEKVNIVTPQFEREYDLEIDFIPKGADELQALISSTPRDILSKMGVRVWETYPDGSHLKEDEIHYLFPGEWYKHLPEGFEIVDISGNKEKFEHGKSDDDIRFGCLPYGFVRKEQKTEQPETGSQKN